MPRLALAIFAMVVLVTIGCHGIPLAIDNPTTIANANYDFVWSQTIETLSRYFEIGYENRYYGRIETLPQPAATCFEPWRMDSANCRERLEATLQTIRRRGFVLIRPAENGGFSITVEVYKELEDLRQPSQSSNFAGSTEITSIEPTKEALVTSAVRPADGWISLGRDSALEALIIADLQDKIDGVAPVSFP